MKNKILLRCVRLAKRRIPQSRDASDPRILVVSTTALGDSLWGAPALESLRTSLPTAYIVLLTSPIGEEALRYNPWVDKTYVLKEPMLRRFYALQKKLRKEGFHDVIVFHASQRLILPLVSLLGATRIIGTSGINKGLDALLTHRIPPSMQHEIERRLSLIREVGATAHTHTLSFFLQPEERAAACHARNKAPLIALHPGSKDGFKRWPMQHFVATGIALQSTGADILITGTQDELPLMQEIARKIPNAKVSNPSLSLRHFAALIEQLDLIVSNDTGPVHLACALQTPVIGLYSPTNALLCGPHKAKEASVIAKPRTCEPCLKRACRRPFCLLQIGPEEVIDTANEILYRHREAMQ